MSIDGVKALRKEVNLDENDYLKINRQCGSDARGYTIYTALDEVIKGVIYLKRIREYLDGPQISPYDNRISRLVLSQLEEEQQARIRRLLEVLVMLVLFTKTNDQVYFHHLLLLERLNNILSYQQDIQKFYEIKIANTEYSIKLQVNLIKQIEKKLDIKRCWYLKNNKPIGEAKILKPGWLLSSIRQRVLLAMPIMNSSEKLVFGFTYGTTYSNMSWGVHYSPNRKEYYLRLGQEFAGVHWIGHLNLLILARCHEILGRPKIVFFDQLNELFTRSNADFLLYNFTVQNIKKGDFVLAYGDLAEVMEIKESSYGYRSYRVRYLAEKPIPDIQEDWFPARYLQLLYTKEHFY